MSEDEILHLCRRYLDLHGTMRDSSGTRGALFEGVLIRETREDVDVSVMTADDRLSGVLWSSITKTVHEDFHAVIAQLEKRLVLEQIADV